MINQETNRSKGYAFIEFTNYKEFQKALNNPEPVILGKQKLVFNSAKNRYDFNSNSNIQQNLMCNEDIKIKNNLQGYDNNVNYNNYIMSRNINDKEKLNIGISNGSTNASSFNSSYNSAFQGEKCKISKKESNPLTIDDINDSPLDVQIKYSLKNMTNLYAKTNPNFMKSKICNYFCFPFMNKDIFENNKDNFYNCSNLYINKDVEIDKNDSK
jgi:RNA recognition motif-containing protein